MTISPELPVSAAHARADAARLRLLLAQRNIKYGRWTYTCEIIPAQLSAAERSMIATASEAIVQAAELITNHIVAHPEWHTHYAFDPAFWRLVLRESGYGMNIPCARFDAVLHDGRFSFIELNTDGCSAMSNVDGMHAAFIEVCGTQPAYGLQAAHYDEIVPRVLDTLLECYARFRAACSDASLPAEPAVAILDLPDEPTHWEFTAIKEALAARGIRALVVSPGDAAFDGHTLTFCGQPVHVIYRRMLGSDYAEHFDELAPVTAAYAARRVCMVGSLRSQIAFSKRLFAFLHDAQMQRVLPPPLLAAVMNHVPWTAPLQPGRAAYHGERLDLLPFVRAHRERFVIKPCVSKLGYGIVQGRFVDDDTWHAAINHALPHDYIVQEFVELPTAQFPTPDDPESVTTRYVHLDPYVFGGKFCGILGRTCADPLLSLRTGERLLPVLYARTNE